MSEENAKNNVVYNLGNMLPLFTVIIIILGLTKQYLFYNAFNVPITYFLGLSEIGLIISGDLLIVIPIFLFLYVLMILIANWQYDKSYKPSQPKLEPKPQKGNIIAFSFVIFNAIFSIVLFLFAKDLFTVGISLFGLSFLLFIATFHKEVFVEFFPTYIAQLAIFFFAFIFCVISFITFLDIEKVKAGKFKGTKVYTTDSTYISTDSSYFIGKTEKYVFLYNVKNKKTRIIPSESVTLIDMQSK